jgi:hypothetical protein
MLERKYAISQIDERDRAIDFVDITAMNDPDPRQKRMESQLPDAIKEMLREVKPSLRCSWESLLQFALDKTDLSVEDLRSEVIKFYRGTP